MSEVPNKAGSADYSRKLRAWYLAGLRKSALEDRTASMATPASLVDFDREIVKRLVADSDKQIEVAQKTANSWTNAEFLSILLVVLLSILAGGLVLLGALH